MAVPLDLAVVEAITALRALGKTAREIADDLNEAGHPSRSGKPWTVSMVNGAAFQNDIPRTINRGFNNGLNRRLQISPSARWLTVEETAELLGVHPNEVWARTRSGEIPSRFLAGARVIARAEIERLFSEQTNEVAA